MDNILTSTELFTYLEQATPPPHSGKFGKDEAGSSFLFFGKTPERGAIKNDKESLEKGGGMFKGTLFWSKPHARDMLTAKEKTDFQLQIFSKELLRLTDFKIYVNGQSNMNSNNQANFELTAKNQSSTGLNRYLLSFDLDFYKAGDYLIEVELFKGGQVFRSEPREVKFYPRKPSLHVLSIGPETNLEYNRKDATDFSNLLKTQAGKGIYENVFMETLTSKENSTRVGITSAFERLYNRSQNQSGELSLFQDDLLIIFISADAKLIDNDFRIISSDFSYEMPLSSSVSLDKDIFFFLDKINCKKLVFIDACHSGSPAKRIGKERSQYWIPAETNSSDLSIISSSQINEVSYESSLLENGVFTEALLEALQGITVMLSNGVQIQADNIGDEGENIGYLSVHEIFNFMKQRVPDLLTKSLGPGKSQTPVLYEGDAFRDLKLFKVK